jgi:outer membrane protein, multidrug efflux system
MLEFSKEMKLNKLNQLTMVLACLLLSSCATLDFLKLKLTPDTTIKTTKLPNTWQAPLPHNGETQKLKAFWKQFDDPLLIELIEASQQLSSSIASAKTRIAEARATRISTIGNARPDLSGTITTSRSVQQPAGAFGGQSGGQQGGFAIGAFNSSQVGLQSHWELDIFGANSILVNSAKTTENAALVNWHEARVAVAAELATSYFNQRFCQQQVLLNQQDLKSREETARLTAISVKAGFLGAASQSLAEASLSDIKQQQSAQTARCDLNIKELVALTGLDESELRQKLNKQAFEIKMNASKKLYLIDSIPAKTITQRPDIINAEAELIAAAANVQSNKAMLLPRVSVDGSIGWMWQSGTGFKTDGKVWSLGPLSITIPIYNSGGQQAKIKSAEIKYEESAVNYRNKIRTAVKEVESALINLHSYSVRDADLTEALQGYQASYKATEAKVKAGFANLIELEDSRRVALQTETALINLEQDRINAWISLYRSAGGDWQTSTKDINKDTLEETTTSMMKKNLEITILEKISMKKAVTP